MVSSPIITHLRHVVRDFHIVQNSIKVHRAELDRDLHSRLLKMHHGLRYFLIDHDPADSFESPPFVDGNFFIIEHH